jgi:hypothetical protein
MTLQANSILPMDALVSIWNKRRLALVTAVLTLSVLSGCNAKPPNDAKLRISMIPTTDPGKALAGLLAETDRTDPGVDDSNQLRGGCRSAGQQQGRHRLPWRLHVRAGLSSGRRKTSGPTCNRPAVSFGLHHANEFEDSLARRSAWALRLR